MQHRRTQFCVAVCCSICIHWAFHFTFPESLFHTLCSPPFLFATFQPPKTIKTPGERQWAISGFLKVKKKKKIGVMYLHLVAILFHHHCVSPNDTSLSFGVKTGGCASNVTKVTSVHAFPALSIIVPLGSFLGLPFLYKQSRELGMMWKYVVKYSKKLFQVIAAEMHRIKRKHIKYKLEKLLISVLQPELFSTSGPQPLFVGLRSRIHKNKACQPMAHCRVYNSTKAKSPYIKLYSQHNKIQISIAKNNRLMK